MPTLSRRDFSRKLFLGAGAAALTGYAAGPFPFRTRADAPLGVALVGLGYYSTDLLAPALQLTRHCRLAGIVTGTPEKAVRWKAQYNIPDANIYNYETFDRIAENPDIDVVYVVLPPSMHAEYSIRAARAGKHVWCEKPMAMTVEECQAMIDAARENGVKLSIGYRLQHEPNTREIMRLAREEPYGPVRLVTAAAGYFDGRTDHWKQKKALGGGSMYDMGVYPLNAARYSTGEEPVAVLAQQFTNRPEIYTEVDETTMFQLEFPSGAIAQCVTSFGMGMNYLHVTYARGNASLIPFQVYSNIQGQTPGGPLPPDEGNQQARQMDDDALAILNDTPVMVPGEEGLRDIRVVEAVYESARTGRRVEI